MPCKKTVDTLMRKLRGRRISDQIREVRDVAIQQTTAQIREEKSNTTCKLYTAS